MAKPISIDKLRALKAKPPQRGQHAKINWSPNTGRPRFIFTDGLLDKLDPVKHAVRNRFLSCRTADDLWVMLDDEDGNTFVRESTQFKRIDSDTLQIKVLDRTFEVKVVELVNSDTTREVESEISRGSGTLS